MELNHPQIKLATSRRGDHWKGFKNDREKEERQSLAVTSKWSARQNERKKTRGNCWLEGDEERAP
jgi:hypothetical protein